jgi:Flp pilus assembly CpaE family ATPase
MMESVCRVLSVEDNPVSAELVRVMLSGSDQGSFEVQTAGTLLEALDRLAFKKFDVILLDLALPDSEGLGTLTTIRAHAPEVPVLVLTASDSEAVTEAALQHGAQDFIVKGQFDAVSLVRALRYAIMRNEQISENGKEQTRPPRARVIGVLGAKGGTGATVIAAHLALEIRNQTRQEVLIADLDMAGGTVGFLMKVDRPYTLQDASLNLHRLDAALLQSFAWKHSSGLDVLQSPGSVRYGEQLREERLRHLIRLVETQYGWIVLDMGRLHELSMTLMDEIDDLLLVTTPDVPSLYEAKRIVQKVTELGFQPEHLHLILNRATRTDVSVQDLSRTFGIPILAFCPEARHDLDRVFEAGELLSGKTPLRRQIAGIASHLLGAEPATAGSRSRARWSPRNLLSTLLQAKA